MDNLWVNANTVLVTNQSQGFQLYLKYIATLNKIIIVKWETSSVVYRFIWNSFDQIVCPHRSELLPSELNTFRVHIKVPHTVCLFYGLSQCKDQPLLAYETPYHVYSPNPVCCAGHQEGRHSDSLFNKLAIHQPAIWEGTPIADDFTTWIWERYNSFITT